MAEVKKIPCRICGKSFKPCGYCQSHLGVFRWRNFACSIECAQKYISDTTTYREAQHKNKNVIPATLPNKEEVTIEKEKSKKTYKKKSNESTSVSDNIVADVVKNDKNKETD